MAPLEIFIASGSNSIPDHAGGNLAPLSLDELGMLTVRYAELIAAQKHLAIDLQISGKLLSTIIENIR